MANMQQELPQPSKPSILEDLPAELKLEVIRACPNIETLLALISASSTYLSIYRYNNPDSIFTSVAIQELASRGVVLDPRAQWIAIRIFTSPIEHQRYGKYGLNPAITAYYEAIEKSTTNAISLPRATCRTLLTIKDALSIWKEIDKTGKSRVCSFRSPTLDGTVQLGGAGNHEFWYILCSWGVYDMLHVRPEETVESRTMLVGIT